MHIRMATERDAADVAEVLLAAFRDFEPLYTPEGYRATTPPAAEIERRLGEGPTWMALEDDAVVGTVSAVLRGPELYVRSMAVRPEVRGRGVARALLDAVHVYAVERGCQRLALTTTPFLTAAIRLYEQAGFERDVTARVELHGTPLFRMTKDLGVRRGGTVATVSEHHAHVRRTALAGPIRSPTRRVERPLWTCPKCGLKFVSRNLWHSCGRATMDDWLGRMGPRARALFDMFEALIAACGPYHVSPAKTRIAFLGRVRFAGITRLSEQGMTCAFALPSPLRSRRFANIEEVVPGWWVHRLHVTDPAQLDARVQSWLRRSYRLMGLQGRLAARRVRPSGARRRRT